MRVSLAIYGNLDAAQKTKRIACLDDDITYLDIYFTILEHGLIFSYLTSNDFPIIKILYQDVQSNQVMLHVCHLSFKIEVIDISPSGCIGHP